jgi:hypothetical protein
VGDREPLLDQHLGHGQALDRLCEEFGRTRRGFGRGADHDSAGLAAATDVDLGLQHDLVPEVREVAELVGRPDQSPVRHRDPRLGEDPLSLVLTQLHRQLPR